MLRVVAFVPYPLGTAPSQRFRLEQRTGQPWKLNPLALSGKDEGIQVMLFRDGRALLHGDITPERARSWYTEVVGC